MAIRTIAMIGTGTQGRAIALLVLRVGYRVILEDFSISTLKEGEASIRDALSKQFANVAISNEQSDHTLDWTNADSSRDAISNLSIRTGVQDAIRDAHLIIETAADELETKLELFTIFDKFARPNAIFATTSVAHPVAEFADVTSCPERCITLQFLPAENPRHLAIIPGPQTSPETIRACTEFAKQLKIEANLSRSTADAPLGTNKRKA